MVTSRKGFVCKGGSTFTYLTSARLSTQGAEEFAFCDTSVAAGWPLFYQTFTHSHTLEGSQAFLLTEVLEP